MNESEYLAGYLKGRDCPCPACGYNLRDLRSLTCPECAAPLTLRAVRYRRDNAITPSFFLGLAGLSLGALLMIPSLASRWSPAQTRVRPLVDFIGVRDRDQWIFDALVIAAGLIAQVLPIHFWLEWRHEMPRRTPRFRWSWAAACWLGPVVAVGVGWFVHAW